jgi:hypothetical protein
MTAKCGILCHSKNAAVLVVTDTLNICIFAVELEQFVIQCPAIMSGPMFSNVRLSSCYCSAMFGYVRLSPRLLFGNVRQCSAS